MTAILPFIAAAQVCFKVVGVLTPPAEQLPFISGNNFVKSIYCAYTHYDVK